MTVSIIAAVGPDRIIGRGGGLPWRLPEDLKRFKALTTGHPVVMGRKTWNEIKKPLPGRTNVVITRDTAFRAEGATVTSSFEEALRAARAAPGAEEIFVVGGGEIYAQALGVADRMYLTHVEAAAEGDTRFPEWDASAFRLVKEEVRPGLRFADYERVRP